MSEHNWFGEGYSVSDNSNQKEILVNPFHEFNQYSEKNFESEYFTPHTESCWTTTESWKQFLLLLRYEFIPPDTKKISILKKTEFIS